MGYIIDCLMFVLGCVTGVILTWIFIKARFTNGTFDVNESDANKDIYKLTIDDFNKLHRRRYLLVRITRK